MENGIARVVGCNHFAHRCNAGPVGRSCSDAVLDFVNLRPRESGLVDRDGSRRRVPGSLLSGARGPRCHRDQVAAGAEYRSIVTSMPSAPKRESLLGGTWTPRKSSPKVRRIVAFGAVTGRDGCADLAWSNRSEISSKTSSSSYLPFGNSQTQYENWLTPSSRRPLGVTRGSPATQDLPGVKPSRAHHRLRSPAGLVRLSDTWTPSAVVSIWSPLLWLSLPEMWRAINGVVAIWHVGRG